MVTRQAAQAPSSTDSHPPFLPLEENISRISSEVSMESNGDEEKDRKGSESPTWIPKINGKTIMMVAFALFFFAIIWEAFFVDPKDRLIQPDFSDKFLTWVQSNPGAGLWAISLVIAGGVVTMVPVGTPLTIGCGYIYRGVYGWKLGLFVATIVSMSGSCLGACTCFLIGRYLMRETVQRWVRKYPLFDAIDVAASEQGLKIMAMLYLTPVLPLGLVSYMCGTTSMHLASFATAKIASLPLYLLYTFIGASAHAFIKPVGKDDEDSNVVSALEGTKQIEENQTLIIAGLVLSILMMTLITRHIKKELMKILEQQKRDKVDKVEKVDIVGQGQAIDDTGIEIGMVARRRGHK